MLKKLQEYLKLILNFLELESLISKTGGKKETLLAAYDAVNKNKFYKDLTTGIGVKKNVTVLGENIIVNLYKHPDGKITINNMFKP